MRLPLYLIAVLALIPAAAAAHDMPAETDRAAQMGADTQEYLMPPDIPVTDAMGRTRGFVTLLRPRGTVIVSFMYTNCESICDVTNAVLAGVDQQLDDQDEAISLVSLGIDPANDTPGALNRTAQQFSASPRWLWLTAGMRGTAPLLDSLGVAFDSLETHDPMFLVGDFCSGRFTRVIGLPHPAELIALAREVPACGAS